MSRSKHKAATGGRAPAKPAAKPQAAFTLRHDAWGKLTLVDASGAEHANVTPIRAFPISDPEHWVSLCERSGHEVACVEDLTALPAEVRGVLERELARREFAPVIRRVLSVSSYLEPAEWEVETDRGLTRFVLKSEDDVRRLSPTSAMIFDAQGIRYLVPDTQELNPIGRRAVERYL